MSLQRSGPPVDPVKSAAILEWVKDFFQQFQLVWHLLLDRRVPIFTKIIPFLTVAYLVFPLALIPDAVLGLGQMDDLAVLLLGLRSFIALCPPQLVAKYQATLGAALETWQEDEKVIIDVEPIEVIDEEGEE
ncbi:MAG TPA: DUF1232 domain-containing protein [Thermoflexia bacterium]|nr:DUF1232 domain-containing protein [Thermoflexia bacterium]